MKRGGAREAAGRAREGMGGASGQSPREPLVHGAGVEGHGLAGAWGEGGRVELNPTLTSPTIRAHRGKRSSRSPLPLCRPHRGSG